MAREIKKYTGKAVAKALRTPKYKMQVQKDKKFKHAIRFILNNMMDDILAIEELL